MGKKGDQEKKVRRITFLNGQSDKVVSGLKPSDGKEMINFFSNLIVNHPELTCIAKSVKKKEKGKAKEKEQEEKSKEKEKEIEIEIEIEEPIFTIGEDKESTDRVNLPIPKPRNPLRDEIVFGLTEIIKKIQKKQLIGVVACDPLTVHIQATLYDLCKEFNVPFLLSKNLNQIGDILKMSKLSCYAFTEKVKESTSLCHSLFKIFLQQPGLSFSDKSELNPCLHSNTEDMEIVDTYKPEFVFDFPPEDNFYIPREEIDLPTSTTNLDESEKKMDDFINIDHQVNHFPPRFYFRDIQLILPWTGDVEMSEKKLQKIGKSLFTVKSSLTKDEYQLDEEIPFCEPKTTVLPSSGRKKREKCKRILDRGYSG
ncbi:uncharacterized protein LOC128392018 [Panonychus citri]|uniref:uncharacterized protein LOC128392018 n=1 Tax=Panonychus citri TaxID=50023 RepID=UPI00230750EA|nr:uncharacterized protein LOC128392018 [Panonychus citri]